MIIVRGRKKELQGRVGPFRVLSPIQPIRPRSTHPQWVPSVADEWVPESTPPESEERYG